MTLAIASEKLIGDVAARVRARFAHIPPVEVHKAVALSAAAHAGKHGAKKRIRELVTMFDPKLYALFEAIAREIKAHPEGQKLRRIVTRTGAETQHDAGADYRVRIWHANGHVRGTCTCEMAYGVVTLKCEGTVGTKFLGSDVHRSAVAKAARRCREHLLRQAAELPTEASSITVAKAHKLLDSVLVQRNPAAIAYVRKLKAHADMGHVRASAFLALLHALEPSARNQGVPTTTGAWGMPRVHRAGIAIPGPARLSPGAYRDIAGALSAAVMRSRARRRQAGMWS